MPSEARIAIESGIYKFNYLKASAWNLKMTNNLSRIKSQGFDISDTQLDSDFSLTTPTSCTGPNYCTAKSLFCIIKKYS